MQHMSKRAGGLHERRKAQTRQVIQENALRLFVERGYDATTVSDVAEAADVSSMTVFRYFPTKEDLVLTDEFDPILAERIRARLPDEPLMHRIGTTLVDGLAKTSTADRKLLLTRLRLTLATPALRARQWDNQYLTQKAIVEALRSDPPDPEQEFRLWVTTGACLAAVTAALTRWAEQGGRGDPHTLAAHAMAIVEDQH
jgi:AcrR family transcriptional regulator